VGPVRPDHLAALLNDLEAIGANGNRFAADMAGQVQTGGKLEANRLMAVSVAPYLSQSSVFGHTDPVIRAFVKWYRAEYGIDLANAPEDHLRDRRTGQQLQDIIARRSQRIDTAMTARAQRQAERQLEQLRRTS
jgi:hypothetical protein